MERRALGRTGLQVSVLGFGGAELGFDSGVTDERAAAVLHPAIDAGLNARGPAPPRWPGVASQRM